MIVLGIIIIILMAMGIVTSAMDMALGDGLSAYVLLVLIIFVFVGMVYGNSYEDRGSIINTYCTKYYSNNVKLYNNCKYNHTKDFSKVINKGL